MKDKQQSTQDELIMLLEKIKTVVKNQTNEQYIPDIIEFCESEHYLGLPVKLYPMQRIILKTFYKGQPGNENIDLTEQEIQLLFELKLDNVLEKYYSGILFRELILVLGRRSGKDFMVSLMALYEVMRLLEMPGGSPFKFYNLAEGNPIFILTVAMSSDQARILFTEITQKMTSSEYFRDKIGHTEADKISLLTPQDIEKQKQLLKSGLDNAASKIKGSVVIMSGHSNSESLLGKRIYALLLDEVASFKTTGLKTSGDRIYSALGPSTADFVRKTGKFDEEGNEIIVLDSKIISISSPRSEEGMLFKLYNDTPNTPTRLAFKLPTWKVSKQWPESMLRQEFKFMSANDFNMEFGAEFSGTAGEKYIPDHYIDEALEIGMELNLVQAKSGIPGIVYYAHLDPAASSHNYALVVLHTEERMRLNERNGQIIKEKIKMFVVDHLKCWQPEGGRSINVRDVDRYIVDLARRFRFGMVSYDNWNSQSSVQLLRRKGIPTKITPFRREYKMKIYDQLEHLLVNHQLALPRKTPFSQIIEMELKCLKRIFLPTGFKIEPNPDAQITTDDFCVSPDTTVFSDVGPCEIKDLSVGDMILTHQGRFRKVIEKSDHIPNEECYEIKPYYGFSLKATGNHPIHSAQKEDAYVSKFIRLDKLRCSDEVIRSFDTTEHYFEIDLADYIQEPKCKNHHVNFKKNEHGVEKIRSKNPNAKWINRKIRSDSSFGYFCGLYAAEGHFSDHGISFSTNIKEKHIHSKLNKCCNSLFGISPSLPVMMEGNGCQITLNSTLIKNFMLDTWGHCKAPEKRLPQMIMIAPKVFQEFVLRGMFDGDGSCSDKCITFTSTSKKLCHQIQHLLLRQRIVSSISISQRKGNIGVINGRTINYNSDLYNVRITDAVSYSNLAGLLRIDHRKTQSRYHKPRYRFIGEGSIYVKIRSIERCELDTVINITVDEDHSFVAESVNTHNCDALAGACGLASESMYTGYPQSGLVNMPQMPSLGSNSQWKIGNASYSDQQWRMWNRKFGI